MNEQEACLALGVKLKGTPKNMYKDYITECENNSCMENFSKFIEKLNKIYLSKNNQREMIRKFNQLKRRDFNSLAEYNDHFTEFSSSLQGIKSENDLVVSYIEGLGDKLGEEVAIRDTNNLEETMRLAIILDKTHSVHKQVNYVSKEINSSRGKHHNGYQNRNSYDNRNRQQQSNFGRNYDANNNTNANSGRFSKNHNRNNNNNSRSNNTDRKCYNCQQVGHISRNCPNSKKVNVIQSERDQEHNNYTQHANVCSVLCNPSRKRTKAYIDGIEIPVYFDTGADISIMSLATTNKYGFKSNPINMKLTSANNSVSKALGITDLLKVQIASNLTEMKFIIMEHDAHPILIGADWFAITDAAFYPNGNLVMFPRKTLSLENDVESHDTIGLHNHIFTLELS